MVVFDDCAFRCRFDRHHRAGSPRYYHHSRRRDHSSDHARPLLTLATYALDVLAGYFGAKYFGATKWGTFGAILGALVGLFFGLIGLFVGPVIGAIVGEVIAGKRMIDAGRAGWGSLIGNIGAMLAKLIIALAMISIFLINVPSPF
ncbi:MAG: hypothetical protein DMF26_14580 [Verrucomicrobia bacterium]|nr:MAG: hypothetical protein DMF26_14580 [Verrucomicrobiota bacterium]